MYECDFIMGKYLLFICFQGCYQYTVVLLLRYSLVLSE
jgi:hypothetical protein